jgi:hypothetical protein
MRVDSNALSNHRRLELPVAGIVYKALVADVSAT